MHRLFKGESIYLAELDEHLPELTLGNTLTFAASTRESIWGQPVQSPKISADISVLFGLEGAYDTFMGNALIRGVSGGEKRRTSIAEALVGGAPLQCWDNSTRGLDSSTALEFVSLLRTLTDESHSTVLMSVYQASENMYQVTIFLCGRNSYTIPKPVRLTRSAPRNSTRSQSCMKAVRFTSAQLSLRTNTFKTSALKDLPTQQHQISSPL